MPFLFGEEDMFYVCLRPTQILDKGQVDLASSQIILESNLIHFGPTQ